MAAFWNRDQVCRGGPAQGSDDSPRREGIQEEESVLDRKRPIPGAATSFTPSFGRTSNLASREGDASSTTATTESGLDTVIDRPRIFPKTPSKANTSVIGNQSPFDSGSRKVSSTSCKPAVRDLVSWLEQVGAGDAVKSNSSGRTTTSCTPSSSRVEFLSSEPETEPEPASLALDPTPPSYSSVISPLATGRPAPASSSIIPTCVPGTDEHSLTLLKYKQYFSERPPMRSPGSERAQPSTIIKKKSYGTMVKVADKDVEGGATRRRAGAEFDVENEVESKGMHT